MSHLSVLELKSIPEGNTQSFESILLFKKVNSKIARNGAEFLAVELGDRTGSFNVTCFSDTPEFSFFKGNEEGSIIRVKGVSDHYQSRFSPRISKVGKLSEEESKSQDLLSLVIEIASEGAEKLWDELQEHIESIEHPKLKATARQVIVEVEEPFKTHPAAITMHHAYCHGLLEHTVHVVRAGKALLPFYPEVNADLAIAGMIIHDTGKAIEFDSYKNPKKTRTGILQGHVVLGYRLTRKAAMQNKLNPDLTERLEHIVLSHQGELEWGAAVMAATPEAVFVSMVDNLDAKMGMVQRALEKTPETQSFSDFMPGLKGSVLTETLQY